MASYGERERNIGLWTAEFGSRRRDSITTDEIAAVMQGWEQQGYAASTLNHRRGALMHLWSQLDGQNADIIRSHVSHDTESPTLSHVACRGTTWIVFWPSCRIEDNRLLAGPSMTHPRRRPESP